MPSSKLYLDLDLRKFIDITGQSSINQLTTKQSSKVKYELAIIHQGVALDLPAGTNISVGVKNPKQLTGNFLADTTAIRNGWGSGSRWYFLLNLDTAELASLMATVAANSMQASFEILIAFPDGQLIASVTTSMTIEKNVIRSDELGSTPLPAAVAWMYRPEIVSATGTSPSLAELSTVTLATSSLVEIVLSGVIKDYQLVTGASGGGTDVAPDDYNATTNNRHWRLVN